MSSEPSVAPEKGSMIDEKGGDFTPDELLSTSNAPSSDDVEQGSPEVKTPVNPWQDPKSFPDGGRQAWTCVAGASACLFVSFGWINCIGTFQDYYELHQLRGYSPSTVAWIPSLQVFFMLCGGPFIGVIFDNYGPRYLLLAGTFLHVFGLMMASISSKYYQFLLSQAVCSPIGASMLFFSAFACVPTWFFAKRGMAIGLTAAGSSLGGVIFPVMVNKLIPEVGYGWTMRICAFLILGLLIFSNLTIRSRLKPTPRPVKLIAFIRPLGELPYFLTVCAAFLFYWGMFIPFSFIILAATERGMSQGLAIYLVPIINAASVFGRTVPGIVGDKIGRFNVMCVLSLFTSIIILALWIPATSNAPIIVFAALFGIGSGAAIGLTPAMIAQISDVKQIGVRTGTIFAVTSFAALTGSPIGGKIVTDQKGKFWGAQIFAGVVCMAGALLFVAARVSLAGWGLKKKI